MRQIILATISPRRRQMFKLFGIPFKAVDSGYEEVVHKHLSVEQLVKYLALGKAKAAAKKYPKAIIIAADSVAYFKGKIIGKPKTRQEAIQNFKDFSGKHHEFITGTAVLDAKTGRLITNVTKSKIYFRKLEQKDILDYIKRGHPYDKAGGFSPQGIGFNLLEKMTGDFNNNLGLPLGFVYNALEKLNVKF